MKNIVCYSQVKIIFFVSKFEADKDMLLNKDVEIKAYADNRRMIKLERIRDPFKNPEVYYHYNLKYLWTFFEKKRLNLFKDKNCFEHSKEFYSI